MFWLRNKNKKNYFQLPTPMHHPFVTMASPAPVRNSGDFDFSSINSLLKPPHCRDSQLSKTTSVFPPTVCYVYIALPCLPRYIKSRVFPPHYRDNAKVKTQLSPGAGGTLVTNDWCIIWRRHLITYATVNFLKVGCSFCLFLKKNQYIAIPAIKDRMKKSRLEK